MKEVTSGGYRKWIATQYTRSGNSRPCPWLSEAETETDLMRITIFGATGLLGKALMREWKEDEVTGFGSADGDIRDEKQVLSSSSAARRPDWIVLAAAYTDVDGCETNRDLAFDVNCRGAVNVARAARQARRPPAFSQHRLCLRWNQDDAIHDQRCTRSPRSVYGQSKAEAEMQLSRDFAGVLHRPHFLAFRHRRKMFS